MRRFGKLIAWSMYKSFAYQPYRPYTTWYTQTRKTAFDDPYEGYNVLIEQPAIKNLVFEGGGAKGIAYVGAMNSLEQKGMLAGIDSVAGSSAGAIQALIYGLGYTVSEMKNILMKTDMSTFLDVTPGQQNMNWLELSWRALLNITTKTDTLGRGLCEGNVMQEWLKNLVEQRILDLYNSAEAGDKKDYLKTLVDKGGAITFKDARDLREKVPEAGVKNMLFTGTNYTQQTLEIFGPELTPDMPLYLGARISSSFPWAFKTIIYNGNEYMDGGVLNNFPMQVFDGPQNEKYCIGKEGANLQTLGVKVDSAAEILRILWKTPEAEAQSFLKSFQKSLAKYFIGADFISADIATDRDTYEKYPHRTIQISDEKFGTLNFSLSQEDKEKLIASGQRYTRDYLLNYFQEGTAISIKVKSLEELKDYVDKESLVKNAERFKAEMQVQVDLKKFLDGLPYDYLSAQIQQGIKSSSIDVFQNSLDTDPASVMQKILPDTHNKIYTLMASALKASLSQQLQKYGYDPALFPAVHFDVLQYTSDLSPVTSTLVNMSAYPEGGGVSYFENVIHASLLDYNLHRLSQNADQIQSQINQYDVVAEKNQQQQQTLNEDMKVLDDEIKQAKQEEKQALLVKREELERQIDETVDEMQNNRDLKERAVEELKERSAADWEEKKTERSQKIQEALAQTQSAVDQQSKEVFHVI